MGSIDMRSAVAEPMGNTPVNGTMTPRGITSIPASSLPTLELVPSTPKLFPWLLWVSDPADTTPTSVRAAFLCSFVCCLSEIACIYHKQTPYALYRALRRTFCSRV